MSTRFTGPSSGVRLRPRLAGQVLLLLFLSTACATGHAPPPASTPARDSGTAGTTVYEVVILEPGHGTTRPVSIDRTEFQRSFQRLAREVQVGKKTPQEAARELLKGQVEQQVEWQQLEGVWLAEVYKDRVLTLVPQDENSRLIPEADEALRNRYVQWCARRGGGDCLHLFDDGPYLRTDDRRTLALALSFGSVLDETLEALGQELNPRVLVATCLWTVSLYLALWLVPTPLHQPPLKQGPHSAYMRCSLPRHVERELARYMECGVLAHGFTRVRCESARTSFSLPSRPRSEGGARPLSPWT